MPQASGVREAAARGRARRDRRRARRHAAGARDARAGRLPLRRLRRHLRRGPDARMLSRQHPRGAPDRRCCRSRSARRTRCRTASPTTSCGWSATAASRISARSSSRRPRASTACRCSPYAADALRVGEGDTRARRAARRRATDERRMADAWRSISTASPGRRTTTRGSRTATSRRNATRNQVANPREAALQGLAKMRALARARLPAGRAAAARAAGHRRAARAGLRGQRRRGARARGARRAAAARRVLVGRGDVGRQRGDGQPLGGYRGSAACISRPPTWSRIFIARSKRRPPRASCARSSPTRSASSSTIRCPRRRRFGDEGAANHTRLRDGADDAPGVEFFVYGRARLRRAARRPRAFPARQTREASAADRPPARPRAGAHGVRAAESAGHRRRRVPQRRDRRRPRPRAVLPRACVPRPARGAGRARATRRARRSRRSSSREAEVSLTDAVATYLFNSQLVPRPDGGLAARRARRMPRERRACRAYLDRLRRQRRSDRAK